MLNCWVFFHFSETKIRYMHPIMWPEVIHITLDDVNCIYKQISDMWSKWRFLNEAENLWGQDLSVRILNAQHESFSSLAHGPNTYLFEKAIRFSVFSDYLWTQSLLLGCCAFWCLCNTLREGDQCNSVPLDLWLYFWQ